MVYQWRARIRTCIPDSENLTVEVVPCSEICRASALLNTEYHEHIAIIDWEDERGRLYESVEKYIHLPDKPDSMHRWSPVLYGCYPFEDNPITCSDMIHEDQDEAHKWWMFWECIDCGYKAREHELIPPCRPEDC